MKHAQDLMALVEASPALVTKQDKAGWLALFAAKGIVEDPLGTRPHIRGQAVARDGNDALGRFYDTFIDRNTIRFEVLQDLVADTEVVRDVLIHTTLPTGLQLCVPAHLHYKLVQEEEAWKIQHLTAHWELPTLSIQALKGGLRGWWTLCVLSWKMLRIQGISGVLGYTMGFFRGIFRRGYRAARAFEKAVNTHDTKALASWPRVELPQSAPDDQFLDFLDDNTTIEIDRLTSAGYVTTFGFRLTGPKTTDAKGIGFFHFDPSKQLSRIRLFGLHAPERA